MENITLATFEFDTQRMEKNIEALQKSLFDLRTEQQRYAKQNSDLQKQYNELDKQRVELIKRGQQESQQYRDLVAQQQAVRTQQQGIFQSQKDLQIQTSKTNSEYNKTVKTFQTLLGVEGEILSMEEAIKNAIDAEITSINAARQANSQILAIRNQLNPAIESQAKQIEELNEAYEKNTKFIKGNATETEKQKMNIGNYTNSITDAANELNIFNGGLIGFATRSQEAGGAGQLFSNSIKAITTGVTGLTKASLAFLSTGIGAAIAGLAGVAAITKEWIDYNKEVVKANRETAAITKLTGDALTQARVQASVLGKTFDVEINKTLEAARALANTFGITYEEALTKIEEGLIKAGPASDEFLDSVKEYPTFFAQAGYSVDEFNSIINTGIDLGIYNDKLPDAIKEFTLSLSEQTKASRESLENAFGEKFTSGLFLNIKNGSITSKEALEQISSEAERIGLNAQQAQQLTADLFRGAGEDAGGALKIFEAVNKSIENQGRALTDVEQSVKDLTDSEMALAQAQAEAFESPGFERWKNKALMILNDVATAWYDTISVITNSTEELEMAALESSARETIKSNAEEGLKEFEAYSEALRKRMGDNFDIDSATKSYIENLNTSLKRALDEKDDLEVRSIRAEIKAIEESQTEKINLLNQYGTESAEERQKQLENAIKANEEELELFIAQQGFRAKSLEENLTFERNISKRRLEILEQEYRGGLVSKTKYEAEKLNIANEYLKAQAEAASEYAKQELDNFIRDNKIMIDSKKGLTQELIDEEIYRLDTIDKLAIEGLNTRLADELITQQEYDNQLLNQLEQTEIKKKELQDRYAEQRRNDEELTRQLEHENRLLNLETEGWEAFEREQLMIDEQYIIEKQKLDDQLANDLITRENYELALKNLEEQTKQSTEQIEKAKAQFKLQIASETFSNLATIAGKETAAGKAFAIAQTTIDTYQGAQAAFSGMAQAIPGPVGIALGIAAAAAAVATGLGNVKKIIGVKEPKINGNVQGYAEGGLINGGFKISRSNGDNRLITAMDGEAILTRDHQMNIGTGVLAAAGVPGFATGGIVGPSSRQVVQNDVINQINQLEISEIISEAVRQGAAEGSLAGSSQGSEMGITNLSDNRDIQQRASF